MTRTLLPLLLLAPAAPAGDLSDAALRKLGPCGWEALFRAGAADAPPCGAYRGTVLYAEGHLPRVKARLQGAAWKGKTFPGDGTIVNRWPGFEVVTAPVTLEPSRLDGAPCYVLEYAPDAPVFGGVRDELRLIAPGVWLGRSEDAATGTPKNWFVLRR